jgi:hypothetical protein
MVKKLTGQVTAGTDVTVADDGTVSAPLTSAGFDALLGPTVGSIAMRSAAGWTLLPPGAAGNFLQTNGANANPSWAASSNVVNSAALDDAFGSVQGDMLYRASGVWQALAIGATANSVLTNSGGVPTWQTQTALLDSAFASAQGSILYRDATAWKALAPGTNGFVLKSGGAGANPSWASGGGVGSVTSVGLSMPAIFTVSGSPVTASGTLTAAFNNQAANTVLAGPSVGSAVPTFRALLAADLPAISTLLDTIGSTQGTVLFRGASTWSALAPGTSGQVLTSGGASANPSWATNSGGGGAAFPTGTLMLFQQTAAPTGWTKQTANNDALLRVVSGTAGTGGSNAFSTINAQTVVGNTTLTSLTIPSHAHSYNDRYVQAGGLLVDSDSNANVQNYGPTQSDFTTGAAGSGGSHNHSVSFNIKYVDLIVAAAP